MDDDPDHWLQRILPTDLVEPFPWSECPSWQPPLKLCFAAELHEAVVAFSEAGHHKKSWELDRQALSNLVGFVWRKRFPLEPQELWSVLSAQGVPDRFQSEIVDLYIWGRRLLAQNAGKYRLRRDVVKGH